MQMGLAALSLLLPALLWPPPAPAAPVAAALTRSTAGEGRSVAGTSRGLRCYYFLLGLGCSLLQHGVVAQFRSFFGDPVTTAHIVTLLLLTGKQKLVSEVTSLPLCPSHSPPCPRALC